MHAALQSEFTERRLLLVDASGFLYRAFHALPDLRTRDGTPTGALTGMINMLRRVQADFPSRYAACVFDPRGPTFREEIYPDYKANRAAMPPELATQIEPIFRAVTALGWPLIQADGLEADDVIGTLARLASARGIVSVIATGDKDLAQLVNDEVVLVDTMTRDGGPARIADREAVIEKFGVPPERIIDYLSLVGDTSDNVPGVHKVGPKTAAKWLQQYGSLDAIMARAPEIGGVVGENLRQALSWLPVARRLVTIKTDCDLSALIPDFDHALLWNDSDKTSLASLRQEFQLDRSLRDIPMDAGAAPDPTDKASLSDTVTMSNPVATPSDDVFRGEAHLNLFQPEINYITVSDSAGLDRLMEEIAQAELTALDTETTSLDPRQARLVGISFATGVGKAFYLPLGHTYAGAPQQLPMPQVIARLQPWLENPDAHKVGQNLKYDSHILASVGVLLKGIAHDTLLESYVWEAHRPHDLDALAQRHLGRKGLSYDDVTGKGANRIGFDQVTVETATRYSCEDADFTLHLHQVLWQQLQQDARLRKIYIDIEIPVSRVLFRMERTGIRIDAALLIEQSEELAVKISSLESRAHELAGQPFNLGSPRQLGDILFGKLGYPPVKKTASGAPSTDEDVLEKLAEDYPLPRVLLEWRSLSKLRSTYTEKLPRLADPVTGRVHTTFSQAVAVTGRLASSDPNLQNIPVRTPEGRRIRQAFIADDDHLLVSADYSQIELRIMAHLSEDPGLMAAFMAGEDVHKATASEVFGIGLSEVTAEQRRVAKMINFGLIYGMSAFGLARNLDIDRQVARNYIDRYFARYPGVARYMEETRLMARSRGHVETVFGRRLWLPEINSPNGPRRQAAERAAINAPMQGTAADLIKMAMIAVQNAMDEMNLKSRLVLQVHDELVLEVPQAELEIVERLLPEKMEGIAELRVPLIVDVGRGRNWDEAH